MGYKVHRKRRYYSRRKSPYTKVLGWVLVAAIVVPAGFFGAKWLSGGKIEMPTVALPTTTTVGSTVSTTVTTAPAPVTVSSQFRGFSLPYTALLDATTLKDAAVKAAAAGFNCAVIELKDKDGNLYYATQTQAGLTAAAATADAVSLTVLTEAFATLKEAGIAPIPLLYAFEDTKAPQNLPAAKVTVAGHADWMWYDGDPQKGGRPWLNPYADAAQTYITALAEELQTAGAGAIMLDGVYFPTQTAQSDFTAGGDASLTKGQVLEKFVSRMDTLCDVPVLLRCSVNAALGNNTAGYDTNPLSLGAAAVLADARVSHLGDKLAIEGEMLAVSAQTLTDVLPRLQDALEKRAEAQSEVSRPATVLLLEGDTVAAQLQALRTADADTSYFVYQKDGNYDFAALSHTTT